MYEERNMTPFIATAVIVLVLVAGGVWYVIGRNRIIKPVPDGDTSSRVILVTPRATPTSIVAPTTEASGSAKVSPTEPEKKEATPTKKPAATNTPTAASPATPTVATPTVKPTEKQASASATPTE